MKKINKIMRLILEAQVYPPENIELIERYFSGWVSGQSPITFFSWKMFGIRKSIKGLDFDFNFNVDNANNFVEKEKIFIDIISEANRVYRYIKIIPDEIPYYFWGIESPIEGRTSYSQQIKKYFSKHVPEIEVVSLSSLLGCNNYKRLYELTYQSVVDSFNDLHVPKDKYDLEIEYRSRAYNLECIESREIAKRAFALFAAESAMMWAVNTDKLLPNLIMLAGERSTDTYKYEFYKRPKGRPVLPKLFVI